MAIRCGESPDWFKAYIHQMEPVVAARQKYLLNFKQKPSVPTFLALKKTKE